MAGTVTGKGTFSEFKYGGRKWTVAQWYKDAMDALSTSTYRAAQSACSTAQESAEIIRLWSMGFFSFQSIVAAGCLDNTGPLAEFLYHLLKPNHPEISPELAEEMIENDDDGKIYQAVKTANPRYGRMLKLIEERAKEAVRASAPSQSNGTTTGTPTGTRSAQRPRRS